MLPVVALVGRPNVGKSTLFNRLIKSQRALVANFPGLTRDRIYGEGCIDERSFIVIDTGGIEPEQATNVFTRQVELALQEAHLILFITDARAGLTPADSRLAKQLRKLSKPMMLVVNKIDNLDSDAVIADFYELGFTDVLAIAAAHGRGLQTLSTQLIKQLPTVAADQHTDATEVDQFDGIKIAVIGRPNVGKSTLVNRLLGEERMVVLDLPGTTRDSVYIPCDYRGDRFTLIDTAGVRRRQRVQQTVEKFSIVKTLQAIDDANVVICVLDATENVTEQDLRLLGFALESGRALVIAVNKWDGLSTDQRSFIRKELDRRLRFVNYATYQFISALHGSGVGDLFGLAKAAYRSATKSLSTPQLTKLLQQAVQQHAPPVVKGHRIKLRYAHVGGYNPPIIVIHGTQTNALPGSYHRYLANFFREKLRLTGTPIQLQLRNSDNPYAGDNKRRKR